MVRGATLQNSLRLAASFTVTTLLIYFHDCTPGEEMRQLITVCLVDLF